MRAFVLLSFVALLLASRAPAEERSQIDMTKLTCKQFTEYNSENQATIMMWLEGYYTEDEDHAVIDFRKMAGDLAELLVYCGNNPTADMITAADEIMGGEDKDDSGGGGQ
jgi:acid stress chaperone HdeB